MSVLSDTYNDIADELNILRRSRICTYGSDENISCDCKYGINNNNEQTGCPELRDIVRYYRNLAIRVGDAYNA